MGGWLSNCAFVLSSFVCNLKSMLPCVFVFNDILFIRLS